MTDSKPTDLASSSLTILTKSPRFLPSLSSRQAVARAKRLQAGVQLLSARILAAGVFLIDKLAPRLGKRVKLKVQSLVVCGNTRITDFHASHNILSGVFCDIDFETGFKTFPSLKPGSLAGAAHSLKNPRF
jgi:hypothetical protein